MTSLWSCGDNNDVTNDNNFVSNYNDINDNNYKARIYKCMLLVKLWSMSNNTQNVHNNHRSYGKHTLSSGIIMSYKVPCTIMIGM